MSVHLQLLGRFQVHRDGAEVPPVSFGGRKVRALLRVLAVRRPDLVTHEVLAEALWPDRQPADPAANVQVLVNRARRALGDPEVIVTGSGGYALGACTVDVAAFLAALDDARAAGADHAAAARACTAALALWGEPLPEDTYAEWAQEARSRLRRARVEVDVRAAQAALGLGDARTAAARAAEAVAAEPLDEAAVAVLARALAAAGDPAQALARLAELRGRLADQLGVDPSAEIERLQRALLRGELRPLTGVAVPVPAPPRTFPELAFVGRDSELVQLRDVVAARGVAVVAGQAGAGKSRLLAELTRGSPLPVLAVRAFLPERAEAWGLARSLLREALATDAAVIDAVPARARGAMAVLLPELGDGPPLDGETFRALVLAGGLRLLEAAVGDGALLVADDLQWADDSSLTLLGSALARLPRLAAVLAHRPDDLAPGALTALPSVVELRLGPLPETAVAHLVGDGALARAVVAGTDGTPFAVAELLRELVRRNALVPGPGGWTPRDEQVIALARELGRDGQRRAVLRRTARETGLRADLLALLALLAREAPASTLAGACGADGRTVLEALSGLAAAGLVRLGEHGWATAHDLVAEAVTAALSPGDRGRLHGLLARALQVDDADPAEIARHHRGAGDSEASASAFAVAARRALDRYAAAEAAQLAAAGLTLAPRPSVRADLLSVRADARAVHGDPAAADDLHEALAATAPGPLRSQRLSRLAMLTFGARDTHRAAELAELALVEAGDDGAARASALETAAVVDMNLDRADRARERAEDALAGYRRLGDAAGVARILDGRAMATFLDGRVVEAVAVFGRVAQLFDDSGDLLRVVTPRSTRGHGLVFGGRPADGLVDTSAALALARDLDAAEGQAYALWHRSEALSALGRPDEAEADAREALAIATAARHRGWTATAHRALGIAHTAAGELEAAEAAFAASAEVAGESLTLFASWAAGRRALVRLAAGRVAGVDALVARALAIGPPLGHYEARSAEVELLAARGDPAAPVQAAAALAIAQKYGYVAGTDRLAELAAAT